VGARHIQALLGSLGRLARTPFSTTLTLLVIGLALAVPMALKVLVTNAQIATGSLHGAIDLSVYMKPEVPLSKAQQLQSNARARPEVASVTLISSEQALEEFRNFSGFGAALQALPQNPLPHVLRVQPRTDSRSAQAVDALKRYFAAWPEVDVVQVDTEWVARFNAILSLLERVLLIAAAVLGAGILAIIGNTIRLEILARREEIEVTKLVGGSNAFVRRPFLYTGMLYGVGGAALACILVQIGVFVLQQPIATLAQLYGSRFVLQGLTLQDVGVLFGASFVLGWIGAWLSAQRHLYRIEPRA
jgi:cell division transport system permease protein